MRSLSRFNQLCLDLFTAPFPTVCALSGHAVAGGNTGKGLAIVCGIKGYPFVAVMSKFG
jgi:enoyl-CoA hydratase/carnithine racemase